MLKMAEVANLDKQWKSVEEKEEAQEKELAAGRHMRCANWTS